MPWALNFRYRCGPCRRDGSQAQAQDGSPHCRVTSDNEPFTIEFATRANSLIAASLPIALVKVGEQRKTFKVILFIVRTGTNRQLDTADLPKVGSSKISLFAPESS